MKERMLMKDIKHGIRRWIIPAGAVLLTLLIIMLYLYWGTDQNTKRQDLRRLSSESYGGAFFAMYDINTYREEDFTTYRGIPTVKAEYTLQTWRDISKYLTRALSSHNSVTNIYLGLDPVSLWRSSGRDEERWTGNLERYLTPYITARQDVIFEILLPTPSLQYWTSLDSVQLEESMAVYGRLVEDMSSYANVTMFFPGGEQWLIANPANYLEDGQTNEDVSKKLFLYTFCDHKFLIAPSNASILFENLTSQVEQEWEEPAVYPDLSDLCMVFFGDSVLVYNEGSMSIPGVVKGLSGAQVYNCGQGGLPASGNPENIFNLNGFIAHFLTRDTTILPDSDYQRGLMGYINEDHEGKRHCFVLNVGLNDYFNGFLIENPADKYDTETYAGALRTGIHKLKDAYPDALILVMAPTYTDLFSGGTEINSEVGGVLTEYVDAAVRVSEEMGVFCMNNYADSGINADNYQWYLADGTHPNGTGSLYLGKQIVEYIGGVVLK